MSRSLALQRRLDRRLVTFAAALVVLVVAVGWATVAQRQRLRQASRVEAENVLGRIAASYGYRLAATGDAQASGAEYSLVAVPGGDLLVVPAVESAPGPASSEWGTHVVGLLAEMSGVFMSFWLARAAGMVPRKLKGQILGLSIVLGVVSYSTANASTVVGTVLTPQHVFASVKDGFVWAAAFPMFARAFGLSSDDLAAAPDA